MEKIFVTKSSMPEYEEYIEAIKPLWDTHWLTNMGEYHNKLEEELKEYLDVPELSLLVNGHMSLELAIESFGFPQGSEVITTPLTFISTTHAIVRNGLEPVFCDVKASDGTIDETKIENLITEKTVAILPVHVYGNICNIERIQEIADKYNLVVIYDAAHAFGTEYNGKGIGNYGDASIFSFHATKVFNTVEGGAVAFHDKKIYEKLYNLKNFGIRGEELVDEVGANAKMNELCAIMGLCNLKNIDKSIQARKKIHEKYRTELGKAKGIKLFEEKDNVRRNYGYFPIIIEEDYNGDRDSLCGRMREQGIYPRKYFYPLTSDEACFKNKYRDIKLDIARDIAKKVMTIPIYEGLANPDVERILDIICG